MEQRCGLSEAFPGRRGFVKLNSAKLPRCKGQKKRNTDDGIAVLTA